MGRKIKKPLRVNAPHCINCGASCFFCVDLEFKLEDIGSDWLIELDDLPFKIDDLNFELDDLGLTFPPI